MLKYWQTQNRLSVTWMYKKMTVTKAGQMKNYAGILYKKKLYIFLNA